MTVVSPSRDRRVRRSDFLFLLVCVLAGLALRLDFLIASDFRLDADEAVVGLMAKHIMEGTAYPVFYYGQHYMGSLEAILVAGVFSFSGVSSWGVKLVPLLFSLAFIPLLYRLVLLIATQRAARFAALLAAIPPATLVVWSGKARGGFIEILVLGVLSLLVLVPWLRAPQPKARGIALMGAILGLGWWVNNQIIYFMLPVGFCILARLIREPGALSSIGQSLTIGLGAFFVGGFPYWYYNLRNDFVSFEMFGSASNSRGVLAHLHGLVYEAQPILLGARKYWSTRDLYSGSSVLVASVYGLLALVWVWTRRGQLLRLLRFELDRASLQELAGLVLLAAGGVFVCSSFGALARAPRYLLPAYVGIFMVAAFSLEAIASYRRWLASALLCVLLTLHLLSAYVHGRQLPGEPIVLNRNRVAKSHTELIDFLVAHEMHWVRTDYWIGHRVAFESNEQVKFVSFGEHRDCRVPEYCERGADPDFTRFMPLVLVNDQVPVVRHGLERRGFTFKLKRLSGYILLYDIKSRYNDLRSLTLESPKITASHNAAEGMNALDGDLTTRWGSAAPQSDSMWFKVMFSEPSPCRIPARIRP